MKTVEQQRASLDSATEDISVFNSTTQMLIAKCGIPPKIYDENQINVFPDSEEILVTWNAVSLKDYIPWIVKGQHLQTCIISELSRILGDPMWTRVLPKYDEKFKNESIVTRFELVRLTGNVVIHNKFAHQGRYMEIDVDDFKAITSSITFAQLILDSLLTATGGNIAEMLNTAINDYNNGCADRKPYEINPSEYYYEQLKGVANETTNLHDFFVSLGHCSMALIRFGNMINNSLK